MGWRQDPRGRKQQVYVGTRVGWKGNGSKGSDTTSVRETGRGGRRQSGAGDLEKMEKESVSKEWKESGGC